MDKNIPGYCSSCKIRVAYRLCRAYYTTVPFASPGGGENNISERKSGTEWTEKRKKRELVSVPTTRGRAECIDRAHRLGTPDSNVRKDGARPQPIIVKFTSYRARQDVFMAKRRLKGTKVVITENLTRRRINNNNNTTLFQATAHR